MSPQPIQQTAPENWQCRIKNSRNCLFWGSSTQACELLVCCAESQQIPGDLRVTKSPHTPEEQVGVHRGKELGVTVCQTRMEKGWGCVPWELANSSRRAPLSKCFSSRLEELCGRVSPLPLLREGELHSQVWAMNQCCCIPVGKEKLERSLFSILKSFEIHA